MRPTIKGVKMMEQFSEIKSAIKAGKKVYWKSKSYLCHVSTGDDLYIKHTVTGNMQYITKDYKVSDFTIEE